MVDASRNQRLGSDAVFGDEGRRNRTAVGVRGFYCLTQPPDQIKYVRFGTLWGTAQASQSSLGQDRNFWYDTNNFVLYVYSAGGNPATHYSGVAAIALSAETLLNLNAVSWLEAQIDWFDGYGVQVQGASDHIWLANIAANSAVENSTVPLGFYIQPTGTPVVTHLYNTDANMNYVGYHFDRCLDGGCNFEVKNCRAYANRAYGIVDNVQGTVNYDYCQPGRMKLAEDRLVALEKNDLRRNVYDRIMIAGIGFVVTFAVRTLLTWRSCVGLK